MTWTAIKDSLKNQPGQPINLLVTGRLINSETGEEIPFSINANDLSDQTIADIVSRQVKSVMQRDAAKPAITLGPVELGSGDPSAEQKARIAFDVAVRTFQIAKAILPFDHPDIAAAQALVVAAYKPEYIGL